MSQTVLSPLPVSVLPGAFSPAITFSPSNYVTYAGLTGAAANTANWRSVVFEYEVVGGDNVSLIFNASESWIKSFWVPTSAMLGNWTVIQITVTDFASNSFIPLRRSQFVSATDFDILVTAAASAAVYDVGGTGNINAFTIDDSTGLLTSLANYTPSLSANMFQCKATPSAKWLYIGHQNGIARWAIDATTKALSAETAAITDNGNFYEGLDISPDGKYLFITALDGTVRSYTINDTNGALTLVTTTGVVQNQPYPLTVSPNGKWLYVADGDHGGNSRILIYSINASTGAITAVTTISQGADKIYKVVVSLDSMSAFGIVNSSAAVYPYLINPADGSLIANGGSVSGGSGTSCRSGIISLDQTHLFAGATAGTTDVGQFNLSAGYVPTFNSNGPADGAFDMCLTPNGKWVYSVNSSTLYGMKFSAGLLVTNTSYAVDNSRRGVCVSF